MKRKYGTLIIVVLVIVAVIVLPRILPKTPPSPYFSWNPYVPLTGQAVTFDASSSSAGSGSIVRYDWKFGDFTEMSGKVVQHTYVLPATYTVTLTVTDSNGLQSSWVQNVQVLFNYG